MSSHELARKLLEFPDRPLIFEGSGQVVSVEEGMADPQFVKDGLNLLEDGEIGIPAIFVFLADPDEIVADVA